MDNFILFALAAGIGVAIITGTLGCFVVWRRMAYFSDSLAHCTLLGIALGVQLGVAPTLTTFLICLSFAALLLWLQHKQPLAADTLLGILAHSALAIGILAISYSDAAALDLHGLLFGDILTVNTSDLALLYTAAAIVLTLLYRYWQPLLLMTLNSDLAAAEGGNTLFLRGVLIVLMTITVSVSIQLIGVLLIASLLIIPAAAARLLAVSPEAMAALAVLFGIGSTIAGLALSLIADAPSGPAIVAAAAALFAIAATIAAYKNK